MFRVFCMSLNKCTLFILNVGQELILPIVDSEKWCPAIFSLWRQRLFVGIFVKVLEKWSEFIIRNSFLTTYLLSNLSVLSPHVANSAKVLQRRYWCITSSYYFNTFKWKVDGNRTMAIQVSPVIRGRWVPSFWTANLEFAD